MVNQGIRSFTSCNLHLEASACCRALVPSRGSWWSRGTKSLVSGLFGEEFHYAKGRDLHNFTMLNWDHPVLMRRPVGQPHPLARVEPLSLRTPLWTAAGPSRGGDLPAVCGPVDVPRQYFQCEALAKLTKQALNTRKKSCKTSRSYE